MFKTKSFFILSSILILFFSVALTSNVMADEQADKLAEAQKKMEQAAREYAELSSKLGGDSAKHIVQSFSFSDIGKAPKARLGINIGVIKEIEVENGVSTSSSNDVAGVNVQGVSPDGPADKAGLIAGDIITALNGQTLTQSGEKSAINQLTDIMKTINPGDAVSVMYQRDGVTQSVNVITDEMPRVIGENVNIYGPSLKGEEFDSEILEQLTGFKDLEIFKDMGEAWDGAKFIFINTSPLGDAELIELSPELGEYFGASEGLLVVKAPSDQALGLRDGDVISSIDGRIPTSVSHAMRIMRSYDVGENVTLNILRKKRKRTVSIKVPERKMPQSKSWNWHENSDGSQPKSLRKKIKILKKDDLT